MITPESAKLIDNPVGQAQPPRPVPLIGVDGEARDFALDRFALFLSKLRYFRTGGENEAPIPFRILRDAIYVEQPGNETDLHMPGMAFLPGIGESIPFGIGPPSVCEGTIDKFAPGTALIQRAEYVETFIVEVWGSLKPERRAIAAGIGRAMGSSERDYGITMKLPDYFNVEAEFTLNTAQRIEDPDVIRNRRRAHLMIDLRTVEVALVAMNKLNTTIDATVLDGNLVTGLDC